MVDEGLRINITFLHFDIPPQFSPCSDDCTCGVDWLQIDNEKYCGKIKTPSEISTPFSIVTNANSIDVTFRSDNFDGFNAGFLAIWSATTEPPTTRTRLVSCGQHSATECSQCPYDGDTWVSEGWCNGDCSWINEQCVLSTRSDLETIYTTASPIIAPITTATTTSSKRLASLWTIWTSTTKPIYEHTTDENSITTSKIDEENVVKSPKYPLPYPINSHQVKRLN